MTTIDQAALMSWWSGMKAIIYTDAWLFTKYYCDTQDTATALSASSRRIRKVVYVDATFNDIVSWVYCSGNTVALTNGWGSFAYPATDLATVKALYYNG